MRYISLFSGIEAASVAFGPLSWEPICFAEVDPFASAVLKHHYPAVPNVGDVTAYEWSRHRSECDLVVGGPPCQAFSVAGKRLSLADDRGNLSLAYVRAVDAIDPLWCLTENVPGWLSTSDNAFGCFLAAMVGADAALVPASGQRWTDAGVVAGPRRTAAWRILDAQYFGVPQRRRRVFVVTVRGSGNWRCAEAIFPVGQSLRWDSPPRREAGQGVARPVASCPEGGSGWRGDADTADNLIAGFNNTGQGWWNGADVATGLRDMSIGSGAKEATLVAAFGGNNTSGSVDVATAVNAHGGPHGRLDFESETFVTHSLRADGFDASEDGTGRVQRNQGQAVALNLRGREGGAQFEAGDMASLRSASGGSSRSYAFHENQRAETTLSDTAGSLKVGGGKPGQGYPALQSGMTVRRLTPRECERLQGFPDNYTLIPYRGKPAADGPRYRAIGNSMAVPVMHWIGHRIDTFEKARLAIVAAT